MANTERAGYDAVRPPRHKRRHRHHYDDPRQPGSEAEASEASDETETRASDDLDDDDRPSRAQETREAADLDDDYDDWEPPDTLDAPPPRPGFVQRWVRTTAKGMSDPQNVAKRSNQRWRPRTADTVPKGSYVPTIQHGQHVGCIGIEGMVLMERPTKIHAKVRQRNREMNRMQMEGVESDLHKVHDPSSGLGMPTLKSKSTVTRGRKVRAADDD